MRTGYYRWIIQVLVVLAAFLPGPGITAETLDSAEARSVLEDFLDSTRSYHASFGQTLVDEDGTVLEQTDGEFWLQRPGRFRWQYGDPWPRLIVAAEGAVWLYDEDLEQVTVRRLAGALEQSPAGLLVSDTVALDDYVISGERTAEGIRVHLTPATRQGDFTRISVGLAAGKLKELLLTDTFGQLTAIQFSSAEQNRAIDDALFRFTPPPGVDVLDERVRVP